MRGTLANTNIFEKTCEVRQVLLYSLSAWARDLNKIQAIIDQRMENGGCHWANFRADSIVQFSTERRGQTDRNTYIRC